MSVTLCRSLTPRESSRKKNYLRGIMTPTPTPTDGRGTAMRGEQRKVGEEGKDEAEKVR